MISQGSYNPEDWSNDCWKCSFAMTEINYIWKYIKIEIYSIVILFYNITGFTVFLLK